MLTDKDRMRVERVKAALKRRDGYPLGQPAPMFLTCNCGREVDMPDHGQPVKCATCGTMFDGRGWILP